MSGDVLFVGSIPFDTSEDVLRDFGPAFGASLLAMPDGEVGPRSHWISRVHYSVFANHPDFEILRQPQKENGVERLNPRNASDSWQFRLRPGVDKVQFGDKGWRLGYARDAINSYFIFKALRDQGLYPQHLRFQVSVPSVNSAVPMRIFAEMSDAEKVRAGYASALADEINTIVNHIPNRDLAIQLDCATEVQEAYGGSQGGNTDVAIARNLPQIEAIVPQIPTEVMVGFHMCFGTLGGWPRFEPADISGVVRMANAFITASGRPVGWVHIPLLANTDPSFYAALSELRPQGARVFLGILHSMESFKERLSIVKRVVPEFGIAAYCGFGRLSPSELAKIKNDHLEALKIVNAG